MALIAVGGGITYATTAASTPTDDYAIGCSSSHHALRLINSDGSCPSGYSRINVAAAPTHLTGAQAAQQSSSTQKSVSINSMVVSASCRTDDSAIVSFQDKAGLSYDVRGSYYIDNSTPGQLTYYYGDNDQVQNTTGDGSGYVSYHEGADGPFTFLSLDQGEANLSLIVTHNGRTFTVQAYLEVSGSDCHFQAQVSPSS